MFLGFQVNRRSFLKQSLAACATAGVLGRVAAAADAISRAPATQDQSEKGKAGNIQMRVAGFQMPVTNDIARNAERIIGAIQWAAQQKAEILLTPEGSLSGYRMDFDVQAVREALHRVIDAAREHAVGLALGTCFTEEDGKCYDQLRFYRPDGTYLGFHSKILCTVYGDALRRGEYRPFEPYATSELRVFEWSPGLVIGGLVCNDMWANPACTFEPDPHLCQQLARKGAKIIFHAVNGGRGGGESEGLEMGRQYQEVNLRMRADAGQVWVVVTDNSFPENIRVTAPAGVINPSGSWVCKASQSGAQMFVYTISL